MAEAKAPLTGIGCCSWVRGSYPGTPTCTRWPSSCQSIFACPQGAKQKISLSVFSPTCAHVQQSLTAADTEEHDAWFRNRATLSSRNDVALEINNLILDRLDPHTEHLALSLDPVADKELGESVNFPVEFLTV